MSGFSENVNVVAGNHNGIAKSLGFNVKAYRYWDDAGRRIDIDGMIEDLKVMRNLCQFLLHFIEASDLKHSRDFSRTICRI